MSFSRYSKLTQAPEPKKSPIAGLEASIDESAGTRFFLHTVSAISSLLMLLFIFTVNQIGPDQFAALSAAIESIDFLNLKLSQTLISDLAFDKPITIFITLSIILYLVYAAVDISRKRKQQSKQIDRSYFTESADISYAIHILLLLLILLSALLNYHPKPKIKITEIEFIPTQIESQKAPTNAKRKAAKQSVSAGKHDPKKPVTPISQAPGKPKVAPSPQPQVKPEPIKQAEPKPSPKPAQAAVPRPQVAKPQPSPAPAPKATDTPKPRENSFAPNSFAPPSPKPQVSPQALPREALQQARVNSNSSSLPAPKTYSATGGTGTSSSGSGTNPSPKFDSSGSGETSNLVARIASIPRAPSMGSGGAYGGPSNPDANNNPNGPASLGARADIEFGPYMSALQRKIKMAWKPPRGSESNRIVVMFTINKNGYIQNIQLVTPSRLSDANAAALDAVKRAAPFDPLPAGSPPSVDIEFTFDYNVFKKERW